VSDQKSDGRPDVVLIVTDDQRADTLRHMSAVQEHLVDKGTRFSRTVGATPTCCPSRSSLLTGLLARRTGVYGNSTPDGGWRTFFDNGLEDRTLATALQARGYRTGLVGKYLNGFATSALGGRAGHRPPGWDLFLTFTEKTGAYYDYTLSDGMTFGREAKDYSTDVLGARAARFIRRTPSGQPLFLVFTPYAPHRPYLPAPRHLDDFAGELPPYRPPSVTENVADKPPFLRDRPRVKQGTIDRIRARQQEQLKSVDDAVAGIVDALRSSGRLRNTLLIYMSDNGLMIGDHHALGKALPYRFATDVPLVIRWDGHVGAGKVDRRLAMTVDVTTTVVRATGAALGTDGFNLLGRRKRSEVLLEGRTSPRVDGSVPHPAYCGLRSDRYLFVRYADGFEELYDYQDDRYETRNRAADPAYADRLQSMRFTALEGIVPKPPGFTE
jgi:arylsulfatase A-like enzyme